MGKLYGLVFMKTSSQKWLNVRIFVTQIIIMYLFLLDNYLEIRIVKWP